MSDKMKKALLELAKGICTALVGFLTALLVSSCGAVTRATIRNYKEGNSVEVKITTNNPTNWNVSPDVDASLTPLK